MDWKDIFFMEMEINFQTSLWLTKANASHMFIHVCCTSENCWEEANKNIISVSFEHLDKFKSHTKQKCAFKFWG